MSALVLSSAESRRFGLRIARASLAARDAAQDTIAALLAQRVDVAILRLATEQCGAAAAFGELGIDALHADTLATWACDLRHLNAAAAQRPEVQIRPAGAEDRSAIEALIASVFTGYPNHYAANPLLDPAQAVAGYAEWALGHVDAADRLCWLSISDGRVSGLACSSHDPAGGECIGVLHGVLPEFARRGIYSDLIRASVQHYAAKGYRRLSISTQIANLRVQRVWQRLAFEPVRTEHTYHLSPLFGRACAATPLPSDDPGTGTLADALVAAHRFAAGGSTRSRDLRMHVLEHERAAGTTRFRSFAQPRRDRDSRRVTLAQAADSRILGWAVSDPSL